MLPDLEVLNIVDTPASDLTAGIIAISPLYGTVRPRQAVTAARPFTTSSLTRTRRSHALSSVRVYRMEDYPVNKQTELNKVFSTVYSCAKRYAQLDHDDLSQLVFIKLLRAQALSSRTPLAWLNVVVKNTAMDMYRKQIVEWRHIDRSAKLDIDGQPCVLSETDELVPVCVQPVSLVCEDSGELAEYLHCAISELPEPHRISFALYAQGASYSEIADRTKTKIGTVRSRLHYARVSLRSRLIDIV